jgi:hypothetical protein
MTEKKTRILCLGWNTERITDYLQRPDVAKVVAFSSGDDDQDRTEYEALYKTYKDRVSLYEGSVADNINGYLRLHADETTHLFWAGNISLLCP